MPVYVRGLGLVRETGGREVLKAYERYLVARLLGAPLIAGLLCLLWRSAETALYGFSQVSVVDSVVDVILSWIWAGRIADRMFIDPIAKEETDKFMKALLKDGDLDA